MGITLKEIGDDCSICPLHQAGMCQGNVPVCYGGEPVYPPCIGMDEDTDMEACLNAVIERENRRRL